jgi:hypothetical protein
LLKHFSSECRTTSGIQLSIPTLKSKRTRTIWHLAHSSKEVSESSAPSSRSPRSVPSLVRYDSDRACISFISLTFTYSLTPPCRARGFEYHRNLVQQGGDHSLLIQVLRQFMLFERAAWACGTQQARERGGTRLHKQPPKRYTLA